MIRSRSIKGLSWRPHGGTGGRPSLQRLALHGSAWTTAGYLVEHAMRLGGNLVLTRLLFPEAFGLMALVWAFLRGLRMFSDVGIGPNIIQSQRGDDPDFLRMAWTVQIIRGAVLWVGAILIAGPVATFYGAAQLGWLIPVTGMVAIISDFNSTRLFTLNRHLALGLLTAIELSSQVFGLAVTIVWAWYAPTVWAFAGGAVISGGVKMILSHTATSGIKDSLRWEPEAIRTLIHFGKWLFFSSAVSFLATQGDRMLLGRYLSLDLLGVYGIAFFISDAGVQLASRLSHRVLYPTFGRVAREDADKLTSVYYAARRHLDIFGMSVTGMLITGGAPLIGFLYDDRYHAAGWMLEIFAIRIAFGAILSPAAMYLLARGNPRYAFAAEVAKALCLCVALPLGWYWASVTGAVWAVVLSEGVRLPVLWWGLHRHGIFSVSRELSGLGWLAVGAILGNLWSLGS